MCRREKHKWRKQRYGDYYERLMAAYLKQYEEYIKRIRKLKKEILSLGDVPNKEVQLIKTLQYFLKIVNLATNFVDKGVLDMGVGKKEEMKKFNDTIILATCRKGVSRVVNKTPIGKNVTNDTLYIGVFSEIEGKVHSGAKTKVINGKNYMIEVDYMPISKWINGKVRATNGLTVKIKQKDLSALDQQLTDALLEVIDKVIED